MRCIFCLDEKDESIEHVFPAAIGGRLTTRRVCRECNSELGQKVDAALCEFLPVRGQRAELKLAGNSGAIPGPIDFLDGEAEIIGSDGEVRRARIQTGRDKIDLDYKLHPKIEEKLDENGNIHVTVSVDRRDTDKIAKIIQRARKRHGLSELSLVDLAGLSTDSSAVSVQSPIIRVQRSAEVGKLPHAIAKIAYEFGHRWFGDRILDDPIANKIRLGIFSSNAEAFDGHLTVGTDAKNIFCSNWKIDRRHHIVFCLPVAGINIIGIRLFDVIFAIVQICIVPKNNFEKVDREGKFLVADAVNGKTVETTYVLEARRLAKLMSLTRSLPPFPDPLI